MPVFFPESSHKQEVLFIVGFSCQIKVLISAANFSVSTFQIQPC